MDELGLGAPELLELAPGLRVQAGVVERDADLVGGGLDERDLPVVEALRRLPPERQRAEDAPAAPNRHAPEALNLIPATGGRCGREEVGPAGHVFQPQRLAGGGDAADQPFAHRQAAVDLAQPRRQPAIALQQEAQAVLGDEVEARDLVAGDVRERIQRRAQHLVHVQAAADRLGDRVEDGEVGIDGALQLWATLLWATPSAASIDDRAACGRSPRSAATLASSAISPRCWTAAAPRPTRASPAAARAAVSRRSPVEARLAGDIPRTAWKTAWISSFHTPSVASADRPFTPPASSMPAPHGRATEPESHRMAHETNGP